jgi:hypothetical protein
MDNVEPVKKGGGCFFYGCITSLVLLLVIGFTGFFGARYALRWANAQIALYTDTKPLLLEKEEPLPSVELAQLKARAKEFQSALEAHTNTPPLVLTSRELGALLMSLPEMQGFKDHFRVALDGSKIKGQLSLPLGEYFKFPFIDTKGRYLNGAGTFRVLLTNDSLSVNIDSLEVKGQPLPEKFMSQLRNKNLAEDIANDPTNAAAISRYESIEVKDSTLTLKAKKAE